MNPERHIRDILSIVMGYSQDQAAVVVYDSRCPLAALLTQGYSSCIPKARFIDFDAVSPEAVLAAFELLKPGDLVVLIQSTNFRLEAFRVRVELFNRSLKVIEHPHLENIKDAEIEYYIDSLAYDPDYYRGTGPALKRLLDTARAGVVDSGGERLVFGSGFEPAKLNIGDYSGMKNTGGQFPIGEVFTEARDLESVNGRVRVFAFGDTSFKVDKPEKPITLEVNKGRVTEVLGATPEFERVLASIRADEGEVWVRELGFGMNRAFTRERVVSDVGTYERMCGVHLSLGAKHAIYKKPGFTRKEARHHVDVFAVTETVALDSTTIYRDGKWIA
ncbi:MAG TPA: hypothetical protein VD883_00370 [Candidatus Omnitrophota bacterium]|nr:hypothetical protein [Candidatus Omnitrophota bacterium]